MGHTSGFTAVLHHHTSGYHAPGGADTCHIRATSPYCIPLQSPLPAAGLRAWPTHARDIAQVLGPQSSLPMSPVSVFTQHTHIVRARFASGCSVGGLQEISELRGRRVVGRRIGHQREAAVSGAQKMNARRPRPALIYSRHDTTRGVLHEAGGGATPRASPPLCAPEVGHTSGFTAAAGCPRWGHHGEARGVPHPLPCPGYRMHHRRWQLQAAHALRTALDTRPPRRRTLR